jgi:hypothetical protein
MSKASIAFADAAAMMVAAAQDDDAVGVVFEQMAEDMEMTRADLLGAYHAAVHVGGLALKAELVASVEGDGTPGPVLDYLVTVSRKAADLPRQ